MHRHLPPVHELMTPELVELHGAARVAAVARAVIAEARGRTECQGRATHSELYDQVKRRLRPQLVPAINATGVVLHTNLGRAPWSAHARAAAQAAAGYVTVELSGETGRRGQRGAELEEKLCALLACEAALVVNNCAAAILLCLRATSRGKQVLVGRGELVEIGGGFRIPDILRESGATLVEVGTTNRTHTRDYASAISADVAAILRVHLSNFRQVGFVAQAPLRELTALGPPVLVDLGSGALGSVADEPTVREQLSTGAALVCFSGDKLFGGPQAGIVVGAKEWVERLRKEPLARALRPCKVTLAALSATVDDHLLGRGTPVQRMIDANLDELREVVQAWQRDLPPELACEVEEVEGQIGGGSVPGKLWPSVALAVHHPRLGALQKALLAQVPAIVGRVSRGRLLFDARTVVPLDQGDELLRGLRFALQTLEVEEERARRSFEQDVPAQARQQAVVPGEPVEGAEAVLGR